MEREPPRSYPIAFHIMPGDTASSDADTTHSISIPCHYNTRNNMLSDALHGIDYDDLCPERRAILRSGATDRQNPKTHIIRVDSAELEESKVVSGGFLYTHDACKYCIYLCAVRTRQPP